jgi:hypothetical protein
MKIRSNERAYETLQTSLSTLKRMIWTFKCQKSLCLFKEFRFSSSPISLHFIESRRRLSPIIFRKSPYRVTFHFRSVGGN